MVRALGAPEVTMGSEYRQAHDAPFQTVHKRRHLTVPALVTPWCSSGYSCHEAEAFVDWYAADYAGRVADAVRARRRRVREAARVAAAKARYAPLTLSHRGRGSPRSGVPRFVTPSSRR
jgi:hypothetical protein